MDYYIYDVYLLFVGFLVSKKDNKIEYNHKQNKLEQLKGFCAMVEEGSLEAAATKRCLSSSAISAQYLSLAQELSIDLFSKKGNRCVLTPTGAEVYKESRRILNEIEAFYQNGIARELSRLDYFLMRSRVLCSIKLKDCKKDATKFVKKFYRYIITVVFCGVFSCCLYLHQTNFMFDRVLYDNSSPLLKKLMDDGSRNISEEAICPFGVTQINLDVYNLLSELYTKYGKKMSTVMFFVGDDPIISMRLTGNDAIDNVFNDQNIITCNTQKSYLATQQQFKMAQNLFITEQQFKIYNLHYNELNNCLNCDNFIRNMDQYPNNLFAKKIEKPLDSQSRRGWIIKYDGYYYVLSMDNIATYSKQDTNKYAKQKRMILWKKMTLNGLKTYHDGFYWNMIAEHGIDI